MASKEHVEFSVRVPLAAYQALIKSAASHERTLAAEVRVAIRDYLENGAKS